MMQKSDLTPGMKVRNKVSGRIGEVTGLSNGEVGCASWCVPVRARTMSGKGKGKWDYPIWNLENLEPA
jgi:hypothetical protein